MAPDPFKYLNPNLPQHPLRLYLSLSFSPFLHRHMLPEITVSSPENTRLNDKGLATGFWHLKEEIIVVMDGLKISEAELMVYLHPSRSKNVSHAIFGELSSMLFKFNETFDGVLLAYSASTKDKLAKILPGLNPCFGVRLKAQLLLFYPKPDMLLEGKVVKLGEQSIHVVVLGFSSATIIEEDIRGEFNYKVKHGEGLFASSINKGHKVEIGTMIRFVVKSFDEEILHISGSLLPPHTGSVSWLDKHAEETLSESNIKKRRDLQTTDDSKQTTDDGTLLLKTNDSTRKSKKHRNSHS